MVVKYFDIANPTNETQNSLK